jgi:predicted DNA-binding ribbon-helix-helix protein
MPMAKGALQKRSVRIAGHRTSIALEPEFWEALVRIAAQRQTSLPRLIAEIDDARAKTDDGPSLASAVRVFLLQNKT